MGVIWNEYRSKESNSNKVLQWALFKKQDLRLGSLEFMNFLKSPKDFKRDFERKLSTFEFWLALAWLGAKCRGKTFSLLFSILHCTVTVQYC